MYFMFLHNVAGTKLEFAFKLGSPTKNGIFKGYIYSRGIYAILTLNAPKWQQSVGTWQFPSYATFLHYGKNLILYF